MEIGAINNNHNFGIPVVPKVTEPKITKTSQVSKEKVEVTAVNKNQLGSSDERRENAVKKAASKIIKQSFAVGDTRFTIFKDVKGELVTRFTSLRDGTVTYFPEPDALLALNGGHNMLDVNV